MTSESFHNLSFQQLYISPKAAVQIYLCFATVLCKLFDIPSADSYRNANIKLRWCKGDESIFISLLFILAYC